MNPTPGRRANERVSADRWLHCPEPTCGRMVRVNRDGSVTKHSLPYSRGDERCGMSGKPDPRKDSSEVAE